MATETDAIQLRQQWDESFLGSYEGKWIAFQNNQVVASGGELDTLASQFSEQISRGKGPIFAFVRFEIVQ
jgi:Family of unknown function (DUF5678)